MRHIRSYDEQLNESAVNERTLKPGDIVTTTGGEKVVILSSFTVKHANKFPYAAQIIKHSDYELLKKGDKKGRRIYNSQFKNFSGWTLDGMLSKKDLKMVLDVRTDMEKKHDDYRDKNYSKIEFDNDRRQYGATAQDGSKVFQGDTVLVKFNNGNFKGTITKVAGTATGEVMVQFPGKSKSRGVKPDNILKKA